AHTQDGQQHQRDKCLILLALHLEGFPHLPAGFLALGALCGALFLLCSLDCCFILTLCHNSYFRVVRGGKQKICGDQPPILWTGGDHRRDCFKLLADSRRNGIGTSWSLTHAGSNCSSFRRAVLLQQGGCFLCGGALGGFFQVLEVFWQLPAACLHRLGVQTTCAVGRTNQRTGHNGKAQFLSQLRVRDELLWTYPTLNWVETRTRTQVLGNGDDVRADGAKITQCFFNFFCGLTHAQNQVGLGNQTEVMRLLEHIQRTLVSQRWADALENTWNGFHVVSEDLWAGFKDFLQQIRLAGEVRGEVFYASVWVELVNLADNLGVEPCAFIGKVITGQTGDGGVVEVL